LHCKGTTTTTTTMAAIDKFMSSVNSESAIYRKEKKVDAKKILSFHLTSVFSEEFDPTSKLT